MGIFDDLRGFIGGGYDAGPQAVPNTAAVSGDPGARSFGDRVMNPLTQAGLALLANNGTRKSDRGMFSGVGEALTGAAQYQEAKTEKNKTKAYLRQHFPHLANQVDAGLPVGDAFKMAMQEKQFGQELELRRATLNQPTDDMREFQMAQRDPAFADYLNRNSTNGRLSTQPIYGVDADGNTVLGQLSNDGRLVPSSLPDGVRPLAPGALNEQKAAGTARGKAAGEASAGLGAARSTAAQVRQQVDSLKSDPALPNVLGSLDSRTPIFRESSARAQAKIDQLQGGAFLQARELLRGGGQITDYEGRKAEAAMIRMNQAQSPEDFMAALDEFNDAVQSGLARLEAAQGGGSSGVQPAASGSSGGFGWSVE